MKIEIIDTIKNGRITYFWTLWDGPEESPDRASGYAQTLEEAVCKILEWRIRIGKDNHESWSTATTETGS